MPWDHTRGSLWCGCQFQTYYLSGTPFPRPGFGANSLDTKIVEPRASPQIFQCGSLQYAGCIFARIHQFWGLSHCFLSSFSAEWLTWKMYLVPVPSSHKGRRECGFQLNLRFFQSIIPTLPPRSGVGSLDIEHTFILIPTLPPTGRPRPMIRQRAAY